MSRRRKNDKRVLTGIPNNNKKSRRSNKIKRQRSNRQPVPTMQKKRKKQRSGKTIALMIMVLVAFVLGAAIGITLALDNGDEDEGPQYENVTVEMTSNLTNTTHFYYDKKTDDVDFNNKYDLAELNMTNETSVSY